MSTSVSAYADRTCPLPLPATHKDDPVGGREGEWAGAEIK